MNKKITLAIALLFGFFMLAHSQETPRKLLDKMADTFDKSSGYVVHFSMNIKQLMQQSSESFEAKIEVKGELFHLTTPDIEAWFNGTTQWVLMRQSDEVNISTPTKEELKQTNPIQILNSYKKGYTFTSKGSRNDLKGRPSFVVELEPEKPTDTERITLYIDKSSYAPNSIQIRQKGGIETHIHINKTREEKNLSDTIFVFDKSKHPDVEIIDLR